MKGESLEGLGSAGNNTAKEEVKVFFIRSNGSVETGKEERKGERSELLGRVVKSSQNVSVWHSILSVYITAML